MEFFRIIDKQVSEKQLQEKIHPNSLEDITDTMLFLENLNTNFLDLLLLLLVILFLLVFNFSIFSLKDFLLGNKLKLDSIGFLLPVFTVGIKMLMIKYFKC